MSRLQLTGVRASLGGAPVLRGIDLDVESHALTAILGPSGCGKTTLLRVVAGFVAPDAGTVAVDQDVLAAPGRVVAPEARGIALVPQEGALFPHLDVAGNVAFGIPRRDPRASTAQRVAEVLELVGLVGLAGARPHELSGGQQQRVALARALAPRPRVVLLDEPFAALDAGLRGSLRRDVRAALAAAGSTAILVTHDQDEALSTADSVAVMADGRIVAHDTPERLYASPADLGVARFVGHLVELPAILRDGRADTALGLLEVSDWPDPSGDHAVVGIRPEQLRLTPAGAGIANGRVRHREYFGHDALVQVELTSGPMITVRTLGSTPDGDDVRVEVLGPVRAYALGEPPVTPGR